ncbi:MAG: acyl-[ACP]--phospholipid O-acyltransferase [Alphaproteobacteria bacterium]|nr:acyl-[ACP]--phospholipid O-acyltransferase [Alphaproteobacteria bacterium]
MSDEQKDLLRSQRFLPLLVTQFLGALNDNMFKNALLTIVALRLSAQSDVLSNIIAGLFILPFFLFSATAGEIADKYDRDRIARFLKTTELGLMLGVALVFLTHNLTLLVILLTLMGTQSAFFGPIKYALLPQLLDPKELVEGNAYIEATTYIAILLGLILGTLLPIPLIIILLIAFAFTGMLASRQIPYAPAPRPNAEISRNIFKATKAILVLIHKNPVIFTSILGTTWFWTIGALVAVQIYPMSGKILNVTEGVITYFLIIFSLGVAAGSIFCGKLLKGLIHATYVPISVLGMGIGLYLLYLLTENYAAPTEPSTFLDFMTRKSAWGISFSLFLLAFFGGTYIVPLNALMQSHAPKSHTASIIAGNNIMNALGMVFAAVSAVIVFKLGYDVAKLFFFASIACLAAFFYTSLLLPDALLRSILQAILSILFRVKITGLENFKNAGRRCLLIANHTSLLDGILIAAFMPEKVVFALNTEWYNKWYIKLCGILVKFYPIDPSSPISLRQMIEQMKKNHKVMIFPEGRITTTGGLMKVYEGAGVIAEKADAKIVPIRINGAQYSKFSYLNKTLKTRFFPKISMQVLPPCSVEGDGVLKGREHRHAISMQLYDIMADMMYKTSDLDENVFVSLLKAAEAHGWDHKIAEDINRKPLTYNALVKRSYILGAAFEKAFVDEKYIGLLLPNALVDVVSFWSLIAVDKIPVMINYSLGLQQLLSSVKTIELKTIVTAHKFIEQGHLEHIEKALQEVGVRLVYLEDFAKTITLKTKLQGFGRHLANRVPAHSANDTAVVLFTSGSEGFPKAVLLSHKNLQANRYQICSILAFNPSDIFFNALPMFHSFGLSVGVILTTLSGIKTFFYPSPLHYRIVPELVYDTNATIICGTDTFFYGYGRMGNPYDFFNLKYAVVGGEKLKPATAALWMEKFGVRIMEGYGATETSPVLCLNTPMYIRKGTVGRFLPGINYRLEDVPGVEEGGRLFVQGDNIMQGYIKADNPGKLEPPHEQWYDTGDIVNVDDEGFVKILGRAKRFAKIAGEMVSLTAVEGVLEQLYPGALQGIVTIPDEMKGEQLVLITDREEAKLPEIRSFFKESGLSELWIPKQVVFMANPPVMGTGKFDYMTAEKIVREKN